MRFTLYDYVAYHNPDGSNMLIRKYGFEPQRKIKNIAETLMTIVSKHGQSALDDVCKIHPDKELLRLNKNTNGDNYNMTGCNVCESLKQNSEKYNSADASTNQNTSLPVKMDNTKDVLMILVASALIIYALKA